MTKRLVGRQRRHRRIRKRVAGLPQRPRLAVFRSHQHFVAQLISDVEGKTIMGCSTRAETFRKATPKGGTVQAAQQLGALMATEALKRGVTRVVFDRGGYRYHGRVQAFAEAARKGGLEF